MINDALDVGVSMIATSDAYGVDGSNKTLVGLAIKGRRDEAVGATKWGIVAPSAHANRVNAKDRLGISPSEGFTVLNFRHDGWHDDARWVGFCNSGWAAALHALQRHCEGSGYASAADD